MDPYRDEVTQPWSCSSTMRNHMRMHLFCCLTLVPARQAVPMQCIRIMATATMFVYSLRWFILRNAVAALFSIVPRLIPYEIEYHSSRQR
jgi:hypothetical protein